MSVIQRQYGVPHPTQIKGRASSYANGGKRKVADGSIDLSLEHIVFILLY